VALEFPRNWLIPMIEDVVTPGTYIENPDPAAQAAIRFTAGDMAISSKYGFEFKNDPTFDFERCQIGQTGLILEVTNLQVDFSQHENSLPGTDNYSSDFKGVYIDELVIGLPSFGNKDSSATVDIFGDNLLIGS
jgi:hypothetical protein